MSVDYRPLLLAPESDLSIECDAAGSLVISVAIAESYDGTRIVTLACALTPMNEYEVADCHEFSFSIVVTETEYDGGFETQASDIARGYIPEECRDNVIPTVGLALIELVALSQPSAIYRVTKGRNLPAKAMVKHDLLTSTLLAMGYRVSETGTDPLSRTYWLLER